MNDCNSRTTCILCLFAWCILALVNWALLGSKYNREDIFIVLHQYCIHFERVAYYFWKLQFGLFSHAKLALWGNMGNNIYKKPVLWMIWMDDGIFVLNQSLNDKGKFLSFLMLKNKYNFSGNISSCNIYWYLDLA